MREALYPEKRTAILPQAHSFPGVMRTGFWICIVIAVAVVLRRVAALIHPSQSGRPQMAALDAFFVSHSALTFAHILTALAFVLLLALSYFSRFSRAVWLARLLFPLGTIVGITAYAMSVHAVGGWIERSAVLFFNSLFLFSLTRAWVYRKRGNISLQQQWMTRAVAILLGIATTRPVMGIFFATSALTHLTPKQFFGIAFWIGFSINTIVIELWLRSKKHPFQFERMASHPGI